MAKRKPLIRKDIKEAADALRGVMSEGLSVIAAGMIGQIMANVKSLPPSRHLEAIKGLSTKGVNEYKQKLLDALAVIAMDALDQARREVPGAKNVRLAGEEPESVKLGEFERLPSKIRKRVLAQSQLLIGTQTADLEKAVFFQFSSSFDTTDSLELLEDDLASAAEDYILGSSVIAGANATAASTINQSRNAFFLDDTVTEQLDAFEFTNGDPVSPICTDLAGTIFSADDPDLNRYWPPLHWNCKSYILPVPKGDLGNREIVPLATVPTKAGRASIQFSESKCSCGCGDHSELDALIAAGKNDD